MVSLFINEEELNSDYGHKESLVKVKTICLLLCMPFFWACNLYTGGISQDGTPIPNGVSEIRQTSGQNPAIENQQTKEGKTVLNQSKMVGGNPDVVTKMPISQTQTQICPKMQLPINQQAEGVNPASSSKKATKAAPTIPFQMLMPILRPHLDKDRDMQLQQVFSKLRVCYLWFLIYFQLSQFNKEKLCSIRLPAIIYLIAVIVLAVFYE
jgi:RCD1-SRO-TAF4 (RST) plant domain